MPTEPLKKILDRDVAKVLAKPITESAVPLLTEIVNDATNVFARSLDSTEGGKDEDNIALFSYYHIIQMADAIGVLLAEGCATPAIPLLRSSFEALLTIRFILQSDSQRRASAYIVANAHRGIRIHKLFDSGTAEGKQFLQAFPGDELVGKADVGSLNEGAKRAVDDFTRLLGISKYGEAEAEYQELKTRRKGRPPEWYQLFDGPKNLKDLSYEVKYGAAYDVLYRMWSDVTHPGDVFRSITKSQDGKSAITSLRDVDQLSDVAGFAAGMMLEAKKIILKAFRPGEEEATKRWYVNEIQKKYFTLYGK